MRLSEAIRLGSMLKPQHHDSGEFHVKLPQPRRVGDVLHIAPDTECSCAMGAAIDAAQLNDAAIDAERGWPKAWRPLLHLLEEPCPACGHDHGTMYRTITALNDDHGWTREQIADFV